MLTRTTRNFVVLFRDSHAFYCCIRQNGIISSSCTSRVRFWVSSCFHSKLSKIFLFMESHIEHTWNPKVELKHFVILCFAICLRLNDQTIVHLRSLSLKFILFFCVSSCHAHEFIFTSRKHIGSVSVKTFISSAKFLIMLSSSFNMSSFNMSKLCSGYLRTFTASAHDRRDDRRGENESD